MKSTIRYAKLSDAKAIAKCHVASWQKIYRKMLPDEALDALSVKEKTLKWREMLKNHVSVLLIECNKQLAGFASLCPARDTDTDPIHCGEISAIYLYPNRWRKGLGTKLFNCAINELSSMGFDQVIVWVLKENRQARKFYESIGFRKTGHSKIEFYDDKVLLNEIRYHRFIPQPFTFKPLGKKELGWLIKWMAKDHVREWWTDRLSAAQIKKKYGARIGGKIIVPYIAYLNDRPIGFIQYYQADKVGGGWWPDQKAGTIGIDQFIGEESLINRGIGTKMISAFIKHLYAITKVKKIIVDVDPSNRRARRCYEKVGFELVKKIETPDGPAYLMVFSKKRAKA